MLILLGNPTVSTYGGVMGIVDLYNSDRKQDLMINL
jgi:hypothetical protein